MTDTIYNILRSPADNFTHKFTSKLLASLFEWRIDLRNHFQIEDSLGAIRFVFWWLQWGAVNYSAVNLDVGLTRVCEAHLLEPVAIADDSVRKIPRLFDYIWQYEPGLQAEYPKSSHGAHSARFADWIVSQGIIKYNLTKLTSLSLLVKELFGETPTVCYAWIQRAIEQSSGVAYRDIFSLVPHDASQLDAWFALREKLHFPSPPRSVVIRFEPCKVAVREINLFGVPSLKIGIGEDARLISQSLIMGGWNVNLVDRDNIQNLTKCKINLFSIPAPEMMITLGQLPYDFCEGAYNIASCPWELPYWPESLLFLIDLMDEVWVHSHYVFSSIPEEKRQKVRLIPLPVSVETSSGHQRKEFGIEEDDFVFFTVFDFGSSTARKNPLAVVQAFLKAFPEDNKIKLLIKSSNDGAQPADRDAFLREITDPRIIYINESFSKKILHDMFRCCDSFVSLHRAEGFGRNIAEAMLLEKPVIVSAFSGNLDFTMEDNSYLVSCGRRPLLDGEYIFSKDQYWAEPDVDQAAEWMLRVFQNREEASIKAQNASRLIADRYSIKACSDKLNFFLENPLNKVHQTCCES